MNLLHSSFYLVCLLFSFIGQAQNISGVYFSLDEALTHPENVKVLDLSFQNISALPDVFDEFLNLEEIILERNNIKILPASVYRLPQLTRLNLAKNSLIDQNALFVGIDSLNHLEDLNISYCKLKYLESAIGGCVELRALNAAGNFFYSLPYTLGHLENLTELDVTNNLLVELPETLIKLSNLETLKVGQNKNLSLAPVFRLLQSVNVTHLQFRDQDIPSQILLNLYAFKTLEFSHCNFLSTAIFSSFSAESLALNYCTGLQIDSLFQILNKDTLLVSLRVCDNTNEEVDLRALTNSHLEDLKLEFPNQKNWNKIVSGFQKMESLKSLDLSNNSIDAYPLILNKCSGLESLNLAGCGVADKKFNINLPQLKLLNLKGCNITENRIADFIAQNSSCYVRHDYMYKKANAKSMPMANTKSEIKSIIINPKIPTKIRLKTGSEIYIPENAFVTKDGFLVTKEVEFTVEEFKNPTDIFLSGIPMTYDSAGVSYIFTSAGMIEVRAYANNQELALAQNVQLDIKMASDQVGSYNLYSLDDESGAWVLNESNLPSNIDSVQSPRASQVSQRRILQDSASWYVSMVAQYGFQAKEILTFKVKQVKKLNTFKINFNNYDKINKSAAGKLFNETELLNKYTFIYEGNNKEEDYVKLVELLDQINSIYNIRYNRTMNRPLNYRNDTIAMIDDFYLTPNSKSDNFILTFICQGQKIAFPVAIQTKSNKPKKIQKEYTKFYTKYKIAYKKRIDIWGAKDLARETFLNRNIDNMWAELITNGLIDSSGNVMVAQNSFSYSIGGLGIINLDKPLRKIIGDPLEDLLANYYNVETKAKLKPMSIYVLDYSKNYALSYNKKRPQTYKKSSVVLVVVLENGDYGIIYDADKARIDIDRNRKLDFNIEVFDQSIGFRERMATYSASLN